ncbi:MAG: MaoC family dehydratase [Fusobacterium varium]|jgi:3-hydroxybutyryl-CoA dehydratase|uniref:Enoyl-CoA hydratase n=1 Tax=Fusobacterium varium ATCC 27725 TaxID=469618 RepID=A0ABM6U5I0_FUSVA|nr:MaoC family dehydratase [Fusobacterium varium]AVQ31582.1 enoyl-CoA hydratase [Fusobacterium varium ATCC 27725]EES62920.1 MaoC-like protein [Fusobacterium varium ATCC 27725]VEH39622.1 (R)-specific enoyl-CoA hydratase [Fusobacterium varium]
MEYKDFKIGMKASISKTITETDVILYSGLSLDTNPLHINNEYAKKTFFKEKIVHGMFSAGLISAVLGTRLPGEGSIYLEQYLSFIKPVFINDTITATVKIIELQNEKKIILLSTVCTNQKEEIILQGQAKILKR